MRKTRAAAPRAVQCGRDHVGHAEPWRSARQRRTASALLLGVTAAGSLTLRNGAKLDSGFNMSSVGASALAGGGTSTALLDGAGTRWTTTQLLVGKSPDGSIWLQIALKPAAPISPASRCSIVPGSLAAAWIGATSDRSVACSRGRGLAHVIHLPHVPRMERPRSPWRIAWLVLGWVLIAAAPFVGAIPGPGGVFLFAAGATLLIRNSIWAKRYYVRIKRRWPRFGHAADKAMRRSRKAVRAID